MTNTTEESLCREFEAWTWQQGLPFGDAQELLHEDISQEQRQWLTAFIIRWDEFFAAK